MTARPSVGPYAGRTGDYLTPEELAALFSVPLGAITELRERRTGPPYIRVGKEIRYEPVAVRRWIRHQTTYGAEDA